MTSLIVPLPWWERVRGGNGYNFHPLLSPSPLRGRRLFRMPRPMDREVHFHYVYFFGKYIANIMRKIKRVK